MNLNLNNLKYALAGGVISACFGALLWFSLFAVPLLYIFCGIGVTVPILFLCFAYGIFEAVIASLIAAILLCLTMPLGMALSFSVFFFPPALLAGGLMGIKLCKDKGSEDIAQSDAPSPFGKRGAETVKTETQADYYPLSPAIFQLALAVAFVTIAVSLYLLSLPDISHYFNNWIGRIVDKIQNTDFYNLMAQSGNPREIIRQVLPTAFAASLAFYGFLFQLAALYCAMRLAAGRKLLKRPLCIWPAELRMPPMAFALFILLWIAAFFMSDNLGSGAHSLTLCLSIITTVLWAGFCTAGLAAVHQATSGALIWIRVIIYICLFSLAATPVILLGLTIMGLFATPFRASPKSGTSSSQ